MFEAFGIKSNREMSLSNYGTVSKPDELIFKFGHNPDIDNVAFEPIVNLSQPINWLTSASPIRIKSGGNVNDSATGSGARKVKVYGLDGDGNPVDEEIVTNGTSASTPTTLSFIRVFRVVVTEVGTFDASNTGTIVIETTSGTELIQVLADQGQTLFCAYTVPKGKVGHLLSLSVQVDARQPADIRLLSRSDILNTSAPFSAINTKLFFIEVSEQLVYTPKVNMGEFDELTDIWVVGKANANNTSVAASFELLLVNKC